MGAIYGIREGAQFLCSSSFKYLGGWILQRLGTIFRALIFFFPDLALKPLLYLLIHLGFTPIGPLAGNYITIRNPRLPP